MTRRRSPNALLVLIGGLAAAFLLAVPIQSQGPDNSQGLKIGLYKGYEVAAGEVLVKLHENARHAPMAQDLDVDRDELVGDGSIRRIHSRSHDVETLIARLSASADVEHVEPNYILQALELPNDPYFTDGSLWGLFNTGQKIKRVAGTPEADIDAEGAWAAGFTDSRGIVVGVVDTGIDDAHPDLGQNVWEATSEFKVRIGDQDITCAIGKHGFNAITKTCDPIDDNGHGTHVSGTIGARGNNGIGVVGVNWTASIMGLKFLDAQGSGTTDDAIDAIQYAIQAKRAGVNVRVLSNSWGGGAYSDFLLKAINDANAEGILFVAAAGNGATDIDGRPYYPASYQATNVVTVAATDNKDQLASFSNWGQNTVELGAPGVNILSTYKGNRYTWLSGTSMATPHVSGVAALVLSKCSGLTPADLRAVLTYYTDPIDALKDKALGGRLNAKMALDGCTVVPELPAPTPDFSIAASPPSQSAKRGTTATYTVTVTPVNGFTGSVGLSLTNCPGGPTKCELDPTAVDLTLSSGPQTSGLTVMTDSATKTWTYYIRITGTSGDLVRSKTVTLTVTR